MGETKLLMRRSVLSLLAALVALGVFAPQAGLAQGQVLYTVAENEAFLRTVDPVSGTTLTSVTINLVGGGAIANGVGLAVNPTDGVLYALIREGGFTNPALVTLDVATGNATVIGETDDFFNDIAFAADGTLYGITREDATDPSSLFTISTTDGTGTLLGALTNGTNPGEAMAYNPDDGLVYHMTGDGNLNTDMILETVDPTVALNPTTVTYSLEGHFGITGATHWATDMFLLGDEGNNLRMLRSDGRLRFMSTADHLIGGMAVMGSISACPPLATLYGAAHQRNNGPTLLYQLDPTDGSQTLIGPTGFERLIALEFVADPSNALAGTLYAAAERMDGTDTRVLVTLDPCTGLGTEVGPNGAAGNLRDLSVQSDGTLFGNIIDFGLGAQTLVTLNLLTGSGTVVGSDAGAIFNPGGGMTFAPDGTLYGSTGGGQAGTPTLYTVDTTTGLGTTVAVHAFVGNAVVNPRINAMDTDETGVLFASVNDGSGGNPNNLLGTVDTATAEVTVFAQTQGGIDAIAFRSADYGVLGSPNARTTNKGTATTFTVNVDPVFGSWDTAVDLTCSVRSGVTCGFDTTPVTPGSAGATSTLTVTPSAGLTFIAPPAPLGGSPWKTPPLSFYVLALVGLALLMLTGVKVLKPTGWTRRLVQYSAMMLLFAGVLAGCGGDNPPPPVAFNITITGTSGSVVRTDMVAVTAN